MDLIDRELALNDYQELCKAVSCVDCPFCIDRLYGGCKVEKYLTDLPSAENTGRWVMFDNKYFCSNCGKQHDYRTYYCPNCGASMENEDE